MRSVSKKLCISFISLILILSSSSVFTFAEESNQHQIFYYDNHYKIDKDKGFTLTEKKKIEEKDNHYGWRLGSLYVSGFTQKTISDTGNIVFLKNTGDQVELGFKLEQDINSLNGDKTLSIANDKKGYDEYFEVSETEFGKGTLIIRHTDYQNIKGKANVYTNYLSAKSKVNADTTIKINEEGDYEVALDYTIKDSPRKIFGKDVFPTYSDYTIRLFKFSVRNGNSMVFPFDIKTGQELSNKSFTENGFRIDLAKSRYLNVFVKRDIVNTDNYTDTRENKPAKDGAVYTEEGLYTITVEDPSTKQVTTKMIYVGNDDRYKAYVTTGMSIDEIDYQLTTGATIADDGNIIYPNTKESNLTTISDTTSKSSNFSIGIIIILIIIALIIGIAIKMKKKHTKSMDDMEDDL